MVDVFFRHSFGIGVEKNPAELNPNCLSVA